MGRAKRDLEEQEAKDARKKAYIVDKGIQNECYRCNELFTAKHEDSTLCPECWEQLMED